MHFRVMPMIVEIPIGSAALAGTLANMRSWLDHNRREPVRFETKGGEPGVVVIRVEFKDDSDAEAFRLLSMPVPRTQL
jgi:hypothetical protein